MSLRNRITVKALIVVALILLLLIPAFMIDNLVSERMQRQQDAFAEVSEKWAGTQTISGPIISIPYKEFYKDTTGTLRELRKYIHVLPDVLKIDGTVIPEKRYRGIFEMVVYGSTLKLEGSFSNLLNQNYNVKKENIVFEEAFISVGISDLRGLEDQVLLSWENKKYSFNSGIESNDVLDKAIHADFKLNEKDSINGDYNFSIQLNLKGSSSLNFTPIGKETLINLKSKWTTPSFDGAFLPDKRTIDASGFAAYWKVLHLNRSYPQFWLNDKYSLGGSEFGINLLLPIDSYTKTDRSIKYAILFIALTFLIFFFLELLNNKSVHPLQYILIGFALCIFYILLLSFSEHIPYNWAYLIASIMTISLITWYALSILKERKLALLVGANLILLYGFIFTIIQIEDYALLMGSLGLFLILTAVMYFSKRISWAGLSEK